jgi:predicted alpha/beta superfamily hydrolase
MKPIFLCLFIQALLTNVIQAQIPKVTSGTINRVDSFKSKFVTARNIDVWLPDGYSPQKKYAVLYMHDGQMLFDAENTWNHTAWEVDEVVGKSIADQKIRDVIVVGIWNGGETRHADYFPQKPFSYLTKVEQDTITAALKRMGRTDQGFKPVSDNYLKFIVQELKPYIDKTYATKPEQANTFIAGSSMGALISMYAICEYPEVFGGAACMSTHWPGIFAMEGNPIPGAFYKYLKAKLPNPATHHIYFDYGDQTLDALYPPLQKKADEIMIEKGYTEVNWMTKYFPGENHSEEAWHKRLEIPLLFLLKK